MRITVLALAAAVVSASASTTLSIPSAQPWTDTGIVLAAGDIVTVTATGTISISNGGSHIETPDGQPWPGCNSGGSAFEAPGLPCWSLIGQVTKKGAAFEVGSSLTFTATTGGEFYLGVNDNYYPDNTGSWTAVITVKPVAGTYSDIHKFSLPGSGVIALTPGPGHAMWFVENADTGNRIGSITTAGRITEYPIPTPNSDASDIVAGPDGALWFTEWNNNANKIGRVTPQGVFTEYPVPTANSEPNGIAAGADGALWFTEQQASAIGRITTTGEFAEYVLPTINSEPIWITAGPDGALWFGEVKANQIGRITTAGDITEYPVPTANSGPNWVAAGPDGALWFTEVNADQIGRITTAGVVTAEYPLRHNSTPYAITAGPDGALWFTERYGERIGRITTDGRITEFSVRDSGQPFGMAAGPDGNLWFAEIEGSEIGRAPACALGLSASFAGSTLTLNFDLGIDTPATFTMHARDSSGPVGKPVSKKIGAAVPPQAFTLTRSAVPNIGAVKVQASLNTSSGSPICSEWTTVNTNQ